MADSALTEKELRFCAEYAAEPNATQAYMKAYPGCTYHTARNEGAKLLAKPCIDAEVKSCREEYRRKCSVSFNRVVRKLAAIAFNDPDDYFEQDDANCGLPKLRTWNSIKPRAKKNIVTVRIKRRKLKSKKPKKGEDDCIFEIEDVEVKMLDPMAALDKLCEYLGVTKGSKNIDEIRALFLASQTAEETRSAAGAGGAPKDGEVKPDAVIDDEPD